MQKTFKYLSLFAILLNTSGFGGVRGVKVENELEHFEKNIRSHPPRNLIEDAPQGKFNRKARSAKSVLPPVFNDCAKAKDYLGTEYRDGVYELNLPGFRPINATCLTKCSPTNATRCCTWTVVIRNHESAKGSFQRSYNEFKVGFGNSSTDYFIGLERLHAMTRRAPQSLLIVDFTTHNEYYVDEFHIKDEKSSYQIYGIKGHALYTGRMGSYYLDENFEFSADSECALKHNRSWWYPTGLCRLYTYPTCYRMTLSSRLNRKNVVANVCGMRTTGHIRTFFSLTFFQRSCRTVENHIPNPLSELKVDMKDQFVHL